MRVLCLINDSDPIEPWRATYDSHRQFWRRCLDTCAPEVDGYFVRSHPDPERELDPERRLLTVKGQEGFSTVLHKLIAAIEHLLTDDYAYVVYTGLSSLYDFPLLLLEPARSGIYAGHLVDSTYVSGAGMVFSSDVARALVGLRDHAASEWQDVAIQQMLATVGIQPEHREMFVFDYSKGLDQIEVGQYLCYRLRDYDDPHRAREREAMAAVFEKIYGHMEKR